jgi:hypothetical protein
MRRNQRTSPLPPDPRAREDVMRPGSQQAAGAVPTTASDDVAARSATGGYPAGRAAATGYTQGRPAAADYPADRPAVGLGRGVVVQLAAAVIMLGGLWVAISPWFLALQTPPGGNARANDLIVGLVIAAIGMLAISRLRGLAGLSAASLVAGIWLIISPFILTARFPVTASMYWSNIWAGAVIIVASLAVLGAGQTRTAA